MVCLALFLRRTNTFIKELNVYGCNPSQTFAQICACFLIWYKNFNIILDMFQDQIQYPSLTPEIPLRASFWLKLIFYCRQFPILVFMTRISPFQKKLMRNIPPRSITALLLSRLFNCKYSSWACFVMRYHLPFNLFQ